MLLPNEKINLTIPNSHSTLLKDIQEWKFYYKAKYSMMFPSAYDLWHFNQLV